jgi:hypothetical protein
MKFTLVIGLLFSMSAFAKDRAINCDIGDDGHGGKWCHYVLSQCNQEADCNEAAACAVKAHNKSFVGDKIVSIDTVSSVVEEEMTTVEIKVVLASKKVKTRYVSLDNSGESCEPVTVK